MAYETILYEVADRVCTITLNRPEKLNAWTRQMHLDLKDAMQQAGGDADIRAIILTGAGRGFCAGADISEGAGSFKVGFKLRDKDKDQSVNEEAFELIDDAPDIVLGEDIGEPFELEDYNPGDYEFAPFATSEDENEAFLDNFGDVLEGELDLEAETQDFEVGETTAAVYAMTEINLTPRLMVLPGARGASRSASSCATRTRTSL